MYNSKKIVYDILETSLEQDFIESIDKYNKKVNVNQINEINNILSHINDKNKSITTDRELYSYAWLKKYKLQAKGQQEK